MNTRLTITIGQYSDAGLKPVNQDCYGLIEPDTSQQHLKGICAAVADGISSSDVSHQASETAIHTLLDDYYASPETWTVQRAGCGIIQAINAWLYSQSRRSEHRYDLNKGYVCTLSALILRERTAHLFHVGDSRIYRLRQGGLEQLTNDHRIWESSEKSYLARALGMADHIEVDYRTVAIEPDDVFLLATDGIFEFISPEAICSELTHNRDNLALAAQHIAEQALAQGSDDNLTLQLIRVMQLPSGHDRTLVPEARVLPLPPALEAGMQCDGYRILRNIHTSSRSHVFLAEDIHSHQRVALKVPSVEHQHDQDYLDRLMMEEWIAKRLHSPHIIQAHPHDQPRTCLYTATEYREGQTLSQWINDHPAPTLEQVRDIIEQVARGLRAFHRQEMLHQDIKPDNLLIDAQGTVIIIDFGSTYITGLEDIPLQSPQTLPGTALYMAPEYFLGLGGSPASDQYSLGVLAYHLLTGTFPYSTAVAQCQSAAAQRRLRYRSILIDEETEVPAWVDHAIHKATRIEPHKRYQDVFEFVHDLRHPNPHFLRQSRPPLIERNPVVFWQTMAAIELIIILILCQHMLTGPT